MMRRRLVAAVALVAWLSLGASSCTEIAWIRVQHPTVLGTQTWAPIDIAIDFDAAAPTGTLQVLLNGNDVTGLFTIDPPSNGRVVAWADFVWDGYVLPGTNVIEARIDDAQGTVVATRSFETTGDPYADAVTSYTIGTNGGFNVGFLPGVVTGPPSGAGLFAGSLDVFSLGLSGEIVVEFVDNAVADGPGVDFTVFENSFLEIGAGLVTAPPFTDPGRVSVSQDGTTWFAFPCNLVIGESPYHPGCAGIYPVLSDGTAGTPHASIPTTEPPIEDLVGVSAVTLPVPEGAGGDSFDLADVGLGWARYVKVEAASFVDGPVGASNAGFDLDAVAAVNSVPATDTNMNGIPDAVE